MQLSWLLYVACVAGMSGLAGAFAQSNVSDLNRFDDAYRGRLTTEQQLSKPKPPEQSEGLPAPQDDIALSSEDAIAISSNASLLSEFGVLNPEVLEVRRDVWRYLPYSKWQPLLANLPPQIAYKPLKTRIVQLMHVKAEAPKGAGNQWFVERVQALIRMQDFSAASKLWQAVPVALRQELPVPQQIKLALALQPAQEACAFLDLAIPKAELSGRQYDRLQLFCLSASEDYREAELKITLAEEMGEPYKPWMVQLSEHFQYQETPVPEARKGMSALDRLMLRSASNPMPPAKTVQPEVSSFPQTIDYAPTAIRQLIMRDRLEEVEPWLNMLDRTKPDSVQTYMLFELVRLLKSDNTIARSKAASTLPPYMGEVSRLNQQDKQLLHAMQVIWPAFGYSISEQAKRISHRQATAQSAAPQTALAELNQSAKAGNVAGYLLSLAPMLAQDSVVEFSEEEWRQIAYDLRALRQERLAKKLIAQYFLDQLVE